MFCIIKFNIIRSSSDWPRACSSSSWSSPSCFNLTSRTSSKFSSIWPESGLKRRSPGSKKHMLIRSTIVRIRTRRDHFWTSSVLVEQHRQKILVLRFEEMEWNAGPVWSRANIRLLVKYILVILIFVNHGMFLKIASLRKHLATYLAYIWFIISVMSLFSIFAVGWLKSTISQALLLNYIFKWDICLRFILLNDLKCRALFFTKYHSESSSMASLMIPDHFSKFRSFEKLCHRNPVRSRL